MIRNLGLYTVLIVILSSAVLTIPVYAARHSTVYVKDRCLSDENGTFIGVGATYMTALWRCKYDRDRLNSDLQFLSDQGFNYIRVLSMVGWYEAWEGKEIAPVSFRSRSGKEVDAWPDYWKQLRDLIDITYDRYGIRTEITIFADAQLMPEKTDRVKHMHRLLNTLRGREHKVILLEVGNEAWQNGFAGDAGIADLREFGKYLADHTKIPVALSAPVSQDQEEIEKLYNGSIADIATIHFSRDIGTSEGGWLPVRSCWDAASMPGIPPVSHNEPIGPGASVASENDPIKLVSAAIFSWTAGLPMYVYHSSAGVFGKQRFEDMPGIRDFALITDILPSDLPNWTRNDGKESSAPFTVYCGDRENTYWTEVEDATDGCHRNIGAEKGNEFICYPQGILSGGLHMQARRKMIYTIYNPLTRAKISRAVKSSGDTVILPQGPGAYVIKGEFLED